MPKSKLSPVPYPSRPATPWKVDVPRSIAGRRVRKFFETEEEASVWIAEFFERLRLGGVKAAVDPLSPSFGRVAGQYLESIRARGGENGTHAMRLSRCVVLWEKHWGARPVDAITVADVERFAARPGWGARSRWNHVGYPPPASRDPSRAGRARWRLSRVR